MTTSSEQVIRDYLDRLHRALADAPRDRRHEISAEIEAHIREEIAQLGREPGGHEVLQILDRLGEPEAIAAETFEVSPETQPTRPRSRALEIFALLFLTVGGFVLPVLGWIVGLILLWISQTWSTRDKILGSFIPIALFGILFQSFFVYSLETCTGGTRVEIKSGGDTRTITKPLICESSGLEQWVGLAILVTLVIVVIGGTFHLARRVAHPRPDPAT